MSRRYNCLPDIIGLTMKSVERDTDGEEIRFETECGRAFVMYHDQSCCEHVYIEDICGDLQDLVGSPIVQAEESTNSDDPIKEGTPDESFTWTFYRLATQKGSVVIRWYGSSNGYYSETADFDEVTGEVKK